MGERPNGLIDTLSGLVSELRRRRVVNTVAAYAAVSFVVLQLAEILFPAFELGTAALRLLFALLVAAAPLVVALSWVYDVSRSGVQRTDADAGKRGPSRVIVGGVLVSAVALGGLGWWAVRSVDTAAGPVVSEASIAVLPFADMSAARDQGYLGEGVAEEVLNLLAQVAGLQVAARTSSFQYRGDADIREIGSQLNVATVLEGSVRRDDQRIRVTAQLIDTQSGFHLWSSTFDREVDDVLAVQDEIAQAIAEALLGELEVADAETGRRVVDVAAQESYWKGREQWNRRDAIGIPEAIRLFNEAIEIDSLYSQAYAGLADAWALLPQFVPSQEPGEALDKAEQFALRAIELDDELPEPHASLGLVQAFRGDRVGALSELGRAITISPSYAPALHWRANVLAEMGRLPEALADAGQAAAVDPLSVPIAVDYGNILLWSGDLDGAAQEFARAGRIEFGSAPAALGRAMVALAREQPVDLQIALTEWAAVSGLPVALAGQLSVGMLTHRQTGQPSAVPTELAGARIDSGTTAALHALLGDSDGALQWLTTAVEDGSWINQYPLVNPVYDLVRGDPEFAALMQRLGA